MYRFVPFEEIDKNKWNGTIHYSPNGNLFGYYWYLRSVYKTWDAIVEEDYISVLPILPKSSIDLYRLTPELGPYSVKPLTADRCSTMMEMMMEHSDNAYHPLQSKANISTNLKDGKITLPSQRLDLIDSYGVISHEYSAKAKEAISKSYDAIRLVSNVKPERIMEYSSRTSEVNQALIRVMYNAVHRGLGWSQGIEDGKTDKLIALSYYISSHNVVHEVYHQEKSDKQLRMYMYDMFIRKGAGQPSMLKMYDPHVLALEMGFQKEDHALTKIRDSWYVRLMEKMGRHV